MIERTKRLRNKTNSTSEGKSPAWTTRRLVSASGAEGHGAMLYLFCGEHSTSQKGPLRLTEVLDMHSSFCSAR